jgi:hypothetical protein
MKIRIVERKKKNCLSHDNYKTFKGKVKCLQSQGHSKEVANKIVGAAKKNNKIDESTYVLDKDDESGSTFDLGMDRIEPAPEEEIPKDERAKTWNRWKISILGVAREYFIKEIMQGGMLERFTDRLAMDSNLLARVMGAVEDGYMNPAAGKTVIALGVVGNPDHIKTKEALMSGEHSVVNSMISYLTILGIEFAIILKNRAFRGPGDDAIEVMQDALMARFDNYILYGRGPAEQRDEFVKKSKEYGWSKKENIPSMYDVRESRQKIKVKII